VASYNAERPHQSLGMATPSSRFTHAQAGRPADASALVTDRGKDWISRKVTTNGVISVAWQEINCGRHRAGRRGRYPPAGPDHADLRRRRAAEDGPSHE
jgi:hypothetical protein